jgi:hypothetical protein
MSNLLARKYQLQVSADNVSWLNVAGVNDLNPSENPTVQGADTYDTNGFNGFVKTITGWQVVAKFLRSVTAAVLDPGQELLRATRFQQDPNARVYVRWWDKNGSADAYAGYGLVTWNPSKTGVADVEEVTVTIQGDGILSPITNPYNIAAVPIITSIQKTGKGAAASVVIIGQGFTGLVTTTGIKFGGTNATSFDVISDNLVTAVLPAGAAGTITVLATNATGPSVQANNYVRTT